MSDSYRDVSISITLTKLKKHLTHIEKNKLKYQTNHQSKSFRQPINNDDISYQPLLTQENRNNLISQLSQDYDVFKNSARPSARIRTAHTRRTIPFASKSLQQDDDCELDMDRINQIMTKIEEPIVLKRKISQENIILNGKRVPFKLHLRNQMRKSMYQDMEKFKDFLCCQQEQITVSKLQNDIYQRFKPEKEKLMSTIYKMEKVKKNKEYRTRSAYNNSYCQILALNKKSRENIKQKFIRILPIESRFQLKQFDLNT